MKFFRHIAQLTALASAACAWVPAALGAPGATNAPAPKEEGADVVIYRATPAGIAAAMAAEKQGSRVIIIEPTAHVGGMMTNGGLVNSDVGDFKNIGGISRAFFDRVYKSYVDTYGADSAQAKMAVLAGYPGIRYEPKVGEEVFNRMLAEHPGVSVRFNQDIAAVDKDGARITGVVAGASDDPAKAQTRYKGKVFIDASYTGDLLAGAGAGYSVGRESRDTYNESLARDIPTSRNIQSSNYRMTTTNDPANRVPVSKPENYNPELYRWWLDQMRADTPLWGKFFHEWWKLPNGKMDTNVADIPGVNYDYPEGTRERRLEIEKFHRDYSLGFLYFLQNDPRVPERIRKEAAEWGLPRDEFADNGHFPRELYLREGRRLNGEYVLTQHDAQTNKRKEDSIGLATYVIDAHATDLRIDADGKMHKAGFIYVNITPYEIPYRAMTPKRAEVENLLVPVCVSSSHVGFASMRLEPTYMIMGEAAGVAAHMAAAQNKPVQAVDVAALRSTLAGRKAILNLPAEVSTAFTWEPQSGPAGMPFRFSLNLPEGSADVAEVLWDFNGDGKVDARGTSVTHAFDSEKQNLVSMLVRRKDGKAMRASAAYVRTGTGEDADRLATLESDGIKREGNLQKSSQVAPFFSSQYQHDNNSAKSRLAKVSWPTPVSTAGTYRVYVGVNPHPMRAGNALVRIHHAGGVAEKRIDTRSADNPFGLVSVGDYRFEPGQPHYVELSNEGADGLVVFDSVRLVRAR